MGRPGQRGKLSYGALPERPAFRGTAEACQPHQDWSSTGTGLGMPHEYLGV